MVWLRLQARFIVKSLVLLPLHASILVFLLCVVEALFVRLDLQVPVLRHGVHALLVLSELVEMFGFVTFPYVGSLENPLMIILDVVGL